VEASAYRAAYMVSLEGEWLAEGIYGRAYRISLG
jgi:hypothetical protein